MKKLLLFVMLLVAGVTQLKANDTIVDVTQCSNSNFDVCFNRFDRVAIQIPGYCTGYWIRVDNQPHTENPVILDGNVNDVYCCEFYGCDMYINFCVNFIQPNIPNETTTELWKHQGYPLPLEAIGADSLEMYNFHWNTGETTATIEVTEPGTYTCGISDQCATATRTFIVRDNVEIYRSGVDPATNKNRVLWQTTPEQAEYISSVKIERDGMVVGTASYLDGQYLDNIGSENAARIYRIIGIDSNGNECPLPSYRFGTFNTIISPDIANPSLMNFTWEDPFIEEGSSYSVAAYRIGRFNESTGEFVAIDQLSAQVHLGKYNMDLFEGDYGIVAAVFNDAKNRDYEELAFSNRSDSGIVGVEENGPSTGSGTLTVYPNPANNVLFVETRRATSLPGETYRIMNPFGQTVMEGQITAEKQQIDVRNLPQGVYFITVGDATRKFVVK